jgi:Sec-independent protein secretion pathway component TatC
MKKPMPHDKQQPLPLRGTEPADLLWLVLKFAGAIGIALALATWVNRLLAQI